MGRQVGGKVLGRAGHQDGGWVGGAVGEGAGGDGPPLLKRGMQNARALDSAPRHPRPPHPPPPPPPPPTHTPHTLQGETWSVSAGGERYNKWWGENHLGEGLVQKYGNSNTGGWVGGKEGLECGWVGGKEGLEWRWLVRDFARCVCARLLVRASRGAARAGAP